MSSYIASCLDFCDDLEDLIYDQAEWSQKTFGSDKDRGPIGALKHLSLEAIECVNAIGTDKLTEELADCFLLLLDACRRSKVNIRQLLNAAEEKMIINKSRKWPKPISDTPVEHIKE